MTKETIYNKLKEEPVPWPAPSIKSYTERIKKMNEQEKKELLNVEVKNKLAEKMENKMNEGQVLIIAAVHDKKAEQYQNLMTVPSKAFAVRGFMDACRDENSSFAKYPQEFNLVMLGVIDSKTGRIYQKDTLEILMEAENAVVK